MTRLVMSTGAAAALLGGCAGSWGPTHQEERVLTADAGTVERLRLETANGSVRVTPWDRPIVRVDARVKSDLLDRLAETGVALELDGPDVLVEALWPGGERRGRDGCDLTVRLPAAVEIVIVTSNDEVVVTANGAFVDVTTSNDEIVITEPGGVIARTSNDNVVIRRASGPVDVRTSNDDVVVTLTADNPGPVRIDTSNDDVELVVGPAFGGTLVARTSNGRVEVRGPGPGRSRGGTTAELSFDRPGEASVVDTSNGDVEIEIEG